LFSANNTPPVATAEDCYAWYRRFIFADFNVTFTKENSKPRQELLETLSTPQVLSEILNWSLEGLKELLDTGDVTDRPSVEQIKLQYIHRLDSALAYFHDKVTVTNSPTDFVFTEIWFRDYVTYCHNNGLKAKNQGEFTNSVKQHLPGVEKTRIRPEPGTSALAAFRYVTFIESVPDVLTVPAYNNNENPKKNTHVRKGSLEEYDCKVSTISTVGTDLPECGNCKKFHKGNCSFPHGPDCTGVHCDYAVKCRDFEPVKKGSG
jgi:phage/plasmid-associated DNA primase